MRLIILLFLLPNICLAQIKLSDSTRARLIRAQIVHQPYIENEMIAHGKTYETSIKPAFGKDWDLAFKDANIEAVIFMQVLPDVEILTETKWREAAKVFGATKFESFDTPKSKLKYLNTDTCWRAMVHSCKNASGYESGIFYVFTKKGKGSLLIYVMGKSSALTGNWDFGMNFVNAFRFKPEKAQYAGPAGIGATYTFSYKYVDWRFTAIVEGFPSHFNGILPGDFLIEIEEEPAIEMDYYEIYEKLTGVEGSELNLIVKRGGIEYDITLEREKLPEEAKVKVLDFSNYDVRNYSVVWFTVKMAFTLPDERKTSKVVIAPNGDKEYECKMKIPPDVNIGKYIEKSNGTKLLEYKVYSGSKTEMDSIYQKLVIVLKDYYYKVFFKGTGDIALGEKSTASFHLKAGVTFMGNIEVLCHPISEGSKEYGVYVTMELKQ